MNKKIVSLLLSFIVTFFLMIKFSIEPLISILLLVVNYLIIDYTTKKYNKKYSKFTIILSIIMSIIYVVCDSVEKTYTINIFNKYLLLNISGYFLIFYIAFINLFTTMDKYFKKEKVDRKIYIGNKEILTTSKLSFWFNFGLFFIINLIFLLRFYPGNLTYDSFNQLSQINGSAQLINNHSILHTGILALFVKFGGLFKSVNLGIFLYSLFQIIIVSLVFSYIMYFLAKHKVPVIFRIITLFFLAIHPVNIIYSFTVWKDILFSLSFVIFTILIYYLSKDGNYFDNKKNIIIFAIISLLVMYLRNNGFLVVFISFIALFILLRKSHKRLLIVFLSSILLFLLSRFIIMNTLHIKKMESREILSLPSQSIARIYKEYSEELPKKDKELIEEFYSNKIGEVYNPIISDNTKGLLNEKYFSKHEGDYIKLNMRLFFKYNSKYIESFVSNSYGYYYMNTDYPSIMIQNTNDMGVVHKNVIGDLTVFLLLVLLGTIIMLIVLWNLNTKQNILLPAFLLPTMFVMSKDLALVKVFLNIGIYVTIVFILLLYNKKNKKNIYYYIPSIILWFIIILSPVYSEFRYLYGLFLLIPIFVGLTVKTD